MSLRFCKALFLSGMSLLPGGLILLPSVLIPEAAFARCVNTTTGVEVTQGTGQPTSGQSVVCNTAAPNPTAATTTISGAAGSTGVSVTVLPGSTVASTARAIGVVNSSAVLNQGTIRTNGLNAFGISATGAGSTLANEGTITTTGTAGHGMNAGISGEIGSNTRFVNRGTNSVSGNLAHGLRSLETSAGTLLTNSGAITATFSNANGVMMNGGSVINEAGGSIRGGLAGIQFGGTFNNSVINSGNITGGSLGAVDMGAGNDSFTSAGNSTVNGTVDGGAGSDTFTFDRTGDAVITHGIVNFEGLVKNGANIVTLDTNVTLPTGGVTTINAGALAVASGRTLASSTVAAAGNGTATLQNGGQITGNVLFGSPASTGTYTFNNLAGATLQGNFQFQGNGSTTLIHAGTLNGNIIGSGAGTFLFDNNGTFNGGITINGTGTNTINNHAGQTINNGVVNITGAQNIVDNAGIFNQGLILNGSTSNSVTNRAGASISQAFTITGDGTNMVTNAGSINNGLTLNGNGTNGIANAAGATINQNVVSNGAASDTVDNSGFINNSILLNAGNDIFINRTDAEVNLPVLGQVPVNGVIDMGAGADQFFMLGGRVNSQVLLGEDSDTAEISGGIITQFVRAGGGSDQLLWTGGTIGGLDMGTEDDVATFSNLTTANLAPGLIIDGGPGTDRLIWNHTASDGVARYINWESFELTNASQLTFSSTLTLGDAGTATGTLSIDPTSTVFAGDGAHSIAPFVSGQLATVINAGTIDLTNGQAAATDTLTVVGNYEGQGGQLLLQTVLGSDGSPSDRLVISAGAASGQTAINVTNLGGPGGGTTSNGILLIDAVDGATTASGAFSLASPVAAGAREYLLFKGGVTGGTTENWYLRSAITAREEGVPPPEPGATSGATPLPPVPGDPNPDPPNSGATPVIAAPGQSVPLYRPEVPVYSVAPSALRLAILATLGTFHERRGEQSVLTTGDNFSAAWGRVYGQDIEQRWSGTVDPSIDGSVWGGQIGLDILRWQSGDGHRDTAGLFFGYSTINADVKGQALGWNDLDVGNIDANTTSVGTYWTHIGPSGWYVDAVLMGSWLNGSAQSDRGIGVDTDGSGVTASLEGGYPIVVAQNWVLEPQAQLVYQHLSLDDQNDSFAAVNFDNDDSWTGRVGLRLQGNLQTPVGLLQPYLKANLWHSFDGTDSINFGSDVISTDFGGTSLELGGGIVAAISTDVSLFATADYTFEVEGEKQQIVEGNVGLRVQW